MSTRGDLDGLGSEVDRIVDEAVASGQAPGVVAGISRGTGEHVSVAGAMAYDGEPLRRDAQFRITSMTKPMTAATVLSLVDAGVLTLDQPIDDLIPELANRRVLRSPDAPLDDTVPAERQVTVRDLLTFTWGFGMQGAMFVAAEPWPVHTAAVERSLATFGPPEPATTPELDTWLARLGELPLLAQPGERWLYQSGAQVLAALAARAAGTTFADVMRERLLEPLGMQDTDFHAHDPARLVTAYERQSGQLEVSDPPDGQWARPPAFHDGGAGLVSTVDDVLAFGRMLLRGGDPVLLPETVAEMTRDQLTSAQRGNVWPGFSFLDDRGWGFGVSVLDDGRYTWDGGFGTTWSNVPSEDLTVVVLTQVADPAGLAAVCDEVLTAARRPQR